MNKLIIFKQKGKKFIQKLKNLALSLANYNFKKSLKQTIQGISQTIAKIIESIPKHCWFILTHPAFVCALIDKGVLKKILFIISHMS